MAEASAATPGSTAESNTPAKQSAAKDRPCPYCHANFTSSSLGRHLDVYIKQKNPKPPDGIHDVDEIRRQRGNITRRQARTSSAKRDGSTPSSVKPPMSHDQRSPSMSQRYTNGDHMNKIPLTISLNNPSWEVTGVINDVQAMNRSNRPDVKREPLRKPSIKTEYALRKKLAEERERSRAMELALKEVLDSVKAASAQTKPSQPFQFDFFAQTFPTLCFRCLVPPPTLSSDQIIPSETSWPIEIPGATQYAVLRKRLDVQLRFWRKGVLEAVAQAGSNGTAAPIRIADIHVEEDETCKPYQDHLTNTFDSWNQLEEAQKVKTWHLEAMRAVVREQDSHGQTHINVERLEQENANLRLQITRLNECQQPREFNLFAPSQLSISREAANSISEAGNPNQFDFDEIFKKWKARVQFSRPAQRPLPQDLSAISDSQQQNGLSPYDHEASNGDLEQDADDDDLMDAPGEMDDELGGTTHNRVPAAPMDRGLVDPKLRAHGDDVMQGIEEDGGDFLGGKLLAGLREYGVQGGRAL